MPQVGTAYVDVVGNFAPLTKSISRASPTITKRLAAISKAAAGVGIAIGAVAVKSALDFETQMRLVETQAGASAKEVNRLSKAVLNYAASGKTQYGPQELARALYRVESAGFRGAEAMDVLKRSSEFAMVGQADLESATRALAAATKTGISGTQNLKKAIGTLNATIGQGQMRMDDLTAALGTGLLVSARQVGLTLTDVGTALALLTRQGMPARMGATRLRMAFSMMAAPTDAAAEALASINLDATDLAKTMREGGIVDAMEQLRSHLDGLSKIQQTQLLTRAFGGARSGATIMALVNNTGDLDEIMQNIIKHAGDMNKSIEHIRKDPAVQLRIAWAQIQTLFVRLGATIIPHLVTVVNDFTSVLTDRSLTSQEKLAKLLDMLSEAVANLAPKVAKVAVGVGFAIAAGIVDGFVNADFGGKIALTAVVIGFFGGKAAFVAIGRVIFGYIAAGMVTALAAGALRYTVIANLVSIGLRGALLRAIPIAFAGFEIFQVIKSAVGGDFKDAGFRLGGMLAGGIVGFFVGGPFGAMIGAGIGGELGDVFGGLFSSEKKLHGLNKRLKDSADALARSYKREHHAAKVLKDSEENLHRAKNRHKRADENLRDAEHRLAVLRGKYPATSEKVRHAEAQVAIAKQHSADASREERRAERLHGVALQAERARLRQLITDERERINTLKDLEKRRRKQFEQARNQVRQDHREHITGAQLRQDMRDRAQAAGRYLNASKRVDNEQKKLNDLYAKAAREIGPKFVKQMKEASVVALQYGRRLDAGEDTLKKLPKFMDDAKRSVFGLNSQGEKLPPTFNSITDSQKKNEKETKDWGQSINKPSKNWQKELDKVGGSQIEAAITIFQGQANIKANTNKSLGAFGADTLQYSLQRPKKRQHGGRIGGAGSGDKINLLGEPGEYVLNRNLTAAIGPAVLDYLNFNVVPRQKGGALGVHRSYPNVSGDTDFLPQLGMALSGLARATVGHINVGDGYRSYAEQARLFNANPNPMMVAPPGQSHHQLGIAADISPERGAYGGRERQFGLYFPMSWEPWHIELRGGATAFQKIPRPVIVGPAGPLKTMGQKALDKSWSAANAMLRKKSMAGGAAGSWRGINSAAEFIPFWNSITHLPAFASAFAKIVPAESGWNPRAENFIGLGHRGWYQFDPPTWSQFGKGSWDNAFDPGLATAAAGNVARQEGWGGVMSRWASTYAGRKRGGLIPRFHEGGLVTGMPGHDQVIAVEPGERVIERGGRLRMDGRITNWETGAVVFEERMDRVANSYRRSDRRRARAGRP